jgi:hypothetical protein
MAKGNLCVAVDVVVATCRVLSNGKVLGLGFIYCVVLWNTSGKQKRNGRITKRVARK